MMYLKLIVFLSLLTFNLAAKFAEKYEVRGIIKEINKDSFVIKNDEGSFVVPKTFLNGKTAKKNKFLKMQISRKEMNRFVDLNEAQFVKKGLKILLDSCNKRSSSACFQASKRMSDVKKKGLYLQKACDLKHPEACYEFSKLLRSKKKKRPYLQKGCKGKVGEACFEHAKLFKKKRGHYYTKACEFGHRDSCYDYGITLKSKKGIKLVEKSCHMDHVEGCFHLSQKKHPKKEFFLKKSCDLNHGKACMQIASKEKNIDKKIFLLETSCASKIYEACTEKAKSHALKDQSEQAIIYAQAGCFGGDLNGCTLLKKIDQVSFKKALTSLKLFCKNKNQKACSNYKKLVK